MDNHLLDAALSYANLGYRVFPLLIGSKLPATDRGCLDATGDIGLIQETWSNGAYNIGISTDGLIVVDIDGKSNPWLSSEDDADKAQDLLDCPIVITPRGGTHRYFKQPLNNGSEYKNTASVIAPGVDTRANGGYVVAPGSNLTEGGGYRWLPGQELVPGKSLSLPPQWLIDALNSKLAKKKLGVTSPDPSGTQEPIPEGERHHTLVRVGGALRRYNLSYDVINAALQTHNITRCQPPMDPDEVEKIAEDVSKYEPDQIATGVVENSAAHLMRAPKHNPNTDVPFPDHLLRPPGFLTDLIDYAEAIAHRKQPILALGGALAMLSAITGRGVQDEVGTRTNLYILNVGGSGAGKETARKVNKDLLIAAGHNEIVGPEAPASASGLISSMNKNPVSLFQWDEIGRLMSAINSKHASPHLTGIITVLMKLFTTSDSMFLGDAYADAKKNIVINQPHAVLLGTTVPENLYENLTAASITDGFMGRLLVFESVDTAPDYETPLVVARPSPDALISAIQDWLVPKLGNLAMANPTPITMCSSPAAAQIWLDLQQRCLKEERTPENRYASLWARCGEKARKLALLHACSRWIQEIDEAAAQWGMDLAVYLTLKMTRVGGMWIAENPYEARVKRVMRYVDGCPGGICSQTDLLKKPMRSMSRREREEVLTHMLDLGIIDMFSEQTTGRPKRMVRAASGGIFGPDGVAGGGVPRGNLEAVLTAH